MAEVTVSLPYDQYQKLITDNKQMFEDLVMIRREFAGICAFNAKTGKYIAAEKEISVFSVLHECVSALKKIKHIQMPQIDYPRISA